MSAEHDAKFHQALLLHNDGRFDAARALCEEIVREQSQHAEALHLLGIIAYQTEDIARAIALIGQAAALEPGNAIFHYHHGLAFQRQRNFDAAIACYDKTIALTPDNPDAHMNRANALATLKNFEAAIISYDRAAALRPQSSQIYSGLGQVLYQLKEFRAAAGSFTKAIDLDPQNAAAHNYLGILLQLLNRIPDAEASFRRAIAIKPDYAEAYSNLGTNLKEQSRAVEATEACDRAITLNPRLADAHHNLGMALLVLGRSADAAASFRRALAIRPHDDLTYTNLIFALDLITSSDTALLQSERKRWCELFAPASSDLAPFFNVPDPDRRIRVGYVSGDFKMHSAALAFGAMLVKFNSSEFEVFAYCNAADGDVITNLFRECVTSWREIGELSDDDVAAMVRADDIDILIDLSGHSPGNRLRVFAKKPAPIQITAWGFNTGTGLSAIDVIFGDAIGIPETDKHFFAEEVRYLPSTICGFFPSLPGINALPALSGSRLVFGSFNRLCKVSDEAWNLWVRVLLAVPESLLMIKVMEFEDVRLKEQVLEQFAKAGVDPTRLILVGKTGWYDHMIAYNRVDICLDPFPHTGGITTLEALMMGVPVITLTWPTLVGRLSTSFLTTLGLTDWIATTSDEYVEIAIRKAAALPALNELRQSLRQKLKSSIIGDAAAYVAVVEREYRTLWREWCARQKNGSRSRKWRLW